MDYEAARSQHEMFWNSVEGCYSSILEQREQLLVLFREYDKLAIELCKHPIALKTLKQDLELISKYKTELYIKD